MLTSLSSTGASDLYFILHCTLVRSYTCARAFAQVSTHPNALMKTSDCAISGLSVDVGTCRKRVSYLGGSNTEDTNRSFLGTKKR